MIWSDFLIREIGKKAEFCNYGDNGQRGPSYIGEHHLETIWERFFFERAASLQDVPKHLLAAKHNILGSKVGNRRQSRQRERLLIFASILIMIHWDRWVDFPEMFFDDGNMLKSDKDLPLTQEDPIIPSSFTIPFSDMQYMFLPPYLCAEGLVKLSDQHRLPFLEEQSPKSSRNPQEQLKISKVKVARGYFLNVEGQMVEADWYARKRCDPSEAEIMKKLRENPARHSRIMKILCELDGPHDKFSILLSWADGGDLYDKLHSPDSMINPFSAEVSWDLCNLQLQKAIIQEMTLLVSAVSYLHSNQIIGPQCYHMDLKPPNILVFHQKYPKDVVGRWKIADFGLSVFHKRSRLDADTSKTSVKRPKGEFQPPEVDEDWSLAQGNPRGINALGDIWSLGAIMCTVLAYVLGGVEGVEDFDSRRKNRFITRAQDDIFFYTLFQNSRPQLKMSVHHWLKEAAVKPDTWIVNLVRLIKWCLNIDAEQRPSANELYGRMQKEVLQFMTEESSVLETTGVGSSHSEPAPLSTTSPPSTPGTLHLPHTPNTLRLEATARSHVTESSSESHEITSHGTSSHSGVQDMIYRPDSPSLYPLSHMAKGDKSIFCSSCAKFLVLKANEVFLMTSGLYDQLPYRKIDRLSGAYSSAVVRWPYIILILKESGRPQLRIYEDTISAPQAPLRSYSDFCDPNTIAASSKGDIAILTSFTTLDLHESSGSETLRYTIPASNSDYERFRSVYFSLTDDAILACCTKRFYAWGKPRTSTWSECFKPENARVGGCPRLLKSDDLKKHTIIYFRQSNSFLVYTSTGFFAILLHAGMMTVSEGVVSLPILSAVISPNDDYVYYIRKNQTSAGGRFRKRPERSKWIMTIYRRYITHNTDTIHIHDEDVFRPLEELECDKETTADLIFRHPAGFEDLMVFTSQKQALFIPSTIPAQQRGASQDQQRSRLSSAAGNEADTQSDPGLLPRTRIMTSHGVGPAQYQG